MTGQTTNQYTVSFGSYSSDDIGNGFGLLNSFTFPHPDTIRSQEM